MHCDIIKKQTKTKKILNLQMRVLSHYYNNITFYLSIQEVTKATITAKEVQTQPIQSLVMASVGVHMHTV